MAIARALMGSPEILFADEPTGNLDSKTGEEIMALLSEINKEQHQTIIMVTHSPKALKAVHGSSPCRTERFCAPEALQQEMPCNTDKRAKHS